MTAQTFLTLSQLLAQCDGAAYWLIDPVLHDPVEAVPELASCAKHPITITHPDSASFKAPYLALCPSGLAGNKLHDAMLALALAEGNKSSEPGEPQPRSIAALLLTQQTPPSLILGLNHASVVKDTRSQLRILRYWDPRITSDLINTPSLHNLFPTWVDSLHWAHVADGGQLQVHHCEGSKAPADSLPPIQALTHQQETALQTLSRANRVKGMLQTQADVQPASMQAAFSAVTVAENSRLTQEDDIVSLAHERLRQASAIETAPRIQDIIALCIQHQLPLSALLAELDPHDWSDIKASTQELTRA